MIKHFFVQYNDIDIASFMVGMTVTTFDVVDFTTFPVESFLVEEIFPDFFMAVETKASLGFLAEWFMAFLAIVFIFGMSLNDGTRHHKMFQTGCVENPGEEQQGDQSQKKRHNFFLRIHDERFHLVQMHRNNM